MDKESKEIELTDDQKTRLLKLSLDSDVSEGSYTEKEKRADLLYATLSSSLPIDKSVVDLLPVLLKGVCQKLRSVAGEPLEKLLHNPDTDISILNEIKEYAKKEGTSTESEVEKDVFLAIYCAAVGSSLVFHNKKITQHSYKDLEQFFRSFSKKDWIPEDLGELFKKARIYCENEL